MLARETQYLNITNLSFSFLHIPPLTETSSTFKRLTLAPIPEHTGLRLRIILQQTLHFQHLYPFLLARTGNLVHPDMTAMLAARKIRPSCASHAFMSIALSTSPCFMHTLHEVHSFLLSSSPYTIRCSIRIYDYLPSYIRASIKLPQPFPRSSLGIRAMDRNVRPRLYRRHELPSQRARWAPLADRFLPRGDDLV